MTAKQESIRMINGMPDTSVNILVEPSKRTMKYEAEAVGRQAVATAQAKSPGRRLGMADGMYEMPDNIDACNDEIAQMFGVAE